MAQLVEVVASERRCSYCNQLYRRNRKYSKDQWRGSEFCSNYCSGQARRIHDGCKSRSERYHRRRGSLPQGSPELKQLISLRTKQAMANPAIKSLLKQKRQPFTEARRQEMSDYRAGMMPRNMLYGNSAYPNIQRGDYDINGTVIYFRSKWEANYALYLDFLVGQGQIKKWEYEAEVFVFHEVQFGTRSYRPDFRITNNNGSIEYHEVKGYMDGRSRTKLRRMKKYYPKVKIILVERDSYMDIKKKLGKMLSFY